VERKTAPASGINHGKYTENPGELDKKLEKGIDKRA